MRHYELMVILDPELEERTVAPSLDRFLNDARRECVVLALEGVPGIGKTTISREGIRGARDAAATVLTSRATEAEAVPR